ncbi:MAG: hypothetical protein J6C37_09425 [Roseburia sp.]|nr:hypothetical protein [Roseburia sp.]
MFRMLKRKYTRLLLLPVTIVFLFYSLIVFILYCNLLETDYKDKISYFGEQQTSNAQQSLRLIELNMKMFFSELDIAEDDVYAQLKLSNGLKKFKNINIDISAIYFASSGSQYTLLLNEHLQFKDNDSLLTQYPQLFSNPSEELQWYYLKYEEPSRDSLLCLQSAAVANEENYYTLGIVIPTSVILPTVTVVSNDSGIFSDFIIETSILPDNSAILFMDTVEEKQAASSDFSAQQSSEYFSSKIGTSPFTLYIQFSKESLNKMLFSFFLGMLAICITLFFAAYITQKLFIKKMTWAFQSLSDQFSNFLDTKDNMTI